CPPRRLPDHYVAGLGLCYRWCSHGVASRKVLLDPDRYIAEAVAQHAPHHQRPQESASQVGRQDAFLSHPCALRDRLEGEKVAHLADRHPRPVCEALIRLVLEKLELDHPEALEVT